MAAPPVSTFRITIASSAPSAFASRYFVVTYDIPIRLSARAAAFSSGDISSSMSLNLGLRLPLISTISSPSRRGQMRDNGHEKLRENPIDTVQWNGQEPSIMEIEVKTT